MSAPTPPRSCAPAFARRAEERRHRCQRRAFGIHCRFQSAFAASHLRDPDHGRRPLRRCACDRPARTFESKIPLASFELAIGLKKGETRLLEKLNAWVAENVKNGKLNAIYKKFHGVELPPDMRG